MHGFIVLISEIDTFFVFEFLAERLSTADIIRVCATFDSLVTIAEILIGRIRREIPSPNIDSSSGRRDFTFQDLDDTIKTIIASLTDAQNSTDLRIVLKLTHLKDVTGVDKNNYLIEISFDMLDQILFLRSQFKIMHTRIISAGHILSSQVCAFSAESGKEDKRSIMVSLISRSDGARIKTHRKLSIFIGRSRPLRLGRKRAFGMIHIELLQLRIDLETCILQRRIDIGTLLKLTRSGSGSTIGISPGIHAEERNVLHSGIRKHVLLT